MPIYAYRCTTCGHAQDVLRKISDPPLSVCPTCGAATFVKQVTAAGFQLKGSGWYVTDFREGGGKKAEPATAPVSSDGAKSTESSSSAATPSPAPAPAAPAPAPAAAAKSGD
jgi:putative FmdB family regulatory protein